MRESRDEMYENATETLVDAFTEKLLTEPCDPKKNHFCFPESFSACKKCDLTRLSANFRHIFDELYSRQDTHTCPTSQDITLPPD